VLPHALRVRERVPPPFASLTHDIDRAPNRNCERQDKRILVDPGQRVGRRGMASRRRRELILVRTPIE